MPWEEDKSTASDPDNPQPDEQLTADEWDAHVGEGHFDPSNLQLGQDADGNPVMTDPQNGGEVVLTYDRSAGSWVLPSLSTEDLRDAQDGQAWETWREIGFESGDWVSLRDNAYSHDFKSTTNTSFTPLRGRAWKFPVNWDLIPSDATVGISAIGSLEASNGTIAVAEVDTFGNINETFADTETTTDLTDGQTPRHTFGTHPTGVKEYAIVGKSSDGSNPVNIRETIITVEAQI